MSNHRVILCGANSSEARICGVEGSRIVYVAKLHETL
jgi:hypothetical protein